MPVGPQTDDSQNRSTSDFRQESGPIFRLMPILLALIGGMLIMLLVVHFFPGENAQKPAQSAETPAGEEAPASSAPPTSALPNDASGGNLGPMQVTSTTASGYPVTTSGAPRAVDYFGPEETQGDLSNQPNSVSTEDASTSPCVDPASSYGRSYRQVDR